MKVGVFTIKKDSLIYSLFFTILLFVLQVSFVFAQGELDRFQETLEDVSNLVNTSSFIAIGLAFLFFFWNLATFILSADTEAKETAKGKMGWAIIAIFVITAIWGIVAFIGGALGIDPEEKANVFDLPAYGASSVLGN